MTKPTSSPPFAGHEPQGAAAGDGWRKLPEELGRPDGSGQPLESKFDATGTIPHAYGAEAGSAAPEAEGSKETTTSGLGAEELERRKQATTKARDEDEPPVVIVSSDAEDDAGNALLPASELAGSTSATSARHINILRSR